jgi:hypothetical protein
MGRRVMWVLAAGLFGLAAIFATANHQIIPGIAWFVAAIALSLRAHTLDRSRDS